VTVGGSRGAIPRGDSRGDGHHERRQMPRSAAVMNADSPSAAAPNAAAAGAATDPAAPSADPAGATPPSAFASDDAPTREQLVGAPVRWPRPSILAAALPLPAGAKVAEGAAALGLDTVGDLLEHLPRDVRESRTVGALVPGEQATISVEVRSIRSRPVRRRGMRPLVEATVFDETGSMKATFFNQPWLVTRYPPGTRLLLHGKSEAGRGFRVSGHAVGDELGHTPEPSTASGGVAHYPASDGITSTQILTLVRAARPALADVLEPLPGRLRAAQGMPDRAAALTALHFPRDGADPEDGRGRLAFEELLLLQLAFLRRRERRRALTGAAALGEEPALTRRWLAELPFELTADQRAALVTLESDLVQDRPMQRLLMGEVGSGKTVLALWAMLRAVENGHQAALMAPTETLAEQHFATIERLMGAEPVPSALLTGSTPARRRAETLGKLASGEMAVVVGTHALIEPTVVFRSLAVAVVDEQHRFGVRQRAALDAKGAGPDRSRSPHMLHMTATPIPRTLALAGYGDLDVTALHELPRGRRPIRTRIVAGDASRERAYEHLREQLRGGRQAYVVCPLVDESDAETAAAGGWSEEARAATAELQRLASGELDGFRLVLLHGQMRPRDKQEAMAAFASGDADVLVATTVIEVGIDVPNASVMLVENAERFGISQLHQLRGRIGRGEHESTCLLVGPPASRRLRALAEHTDGFRLAEIDLELRREGELIGTRQSGLGQFQVARLPDDDDLLTRARACAEAVIARDPALESPEHALLGAALERAFGPEQLEPIPA
jgi:ATP-dependent DNA helicase RecG